MTRTRALESVAHVGEPELERAGEIGVTRPRQSHRLRALSGGLPVGRPGAHSPLPVLVVPVSDHERKRGSERAAVSQAGEHFDGVLFDALPRAPAVALLTAT